MNMQIALLSAGFPPDLDGIGDYTFALARALSRDPRIRMPVQVATSRAPRRLSVDGVIVRECFEVSEPKSFTGIGEFVRSIQPDWLVLQYNPFAFGRRGFCPRLVSGIRKSVRSLGPRPRLAVMFHEVATDEATFGARLMWTWQILFSRQLAGLADKVFVSCESYGRKLGRLHSSRAVLLPVGSNIPMSSISAEEAKRRLGIGDELVLGSFGTCHPTRRFDWIAEAACAVHATKIPSKFIHVGSVPPIEPFKGIPTLFTGSLAPERVADVVRAMDIFLVPFSDGISARRGSAIAALQHAVPVVTTSGKNTDKCFRELSPAPVFLSMARSGAEFARDVLAVVHSPETRAALSVQGFELYKSTFDWCEIATELAEHLQ